MTKTVIEDVINGFLGSKKVEVLAISGRWGVGKTHTLQAMIQAYRGEDSLKWYSYVSAFGAKSIGDLRSMILVKMRPFPVNESRVSNAIESAGSLLSKGRGKALYEMMKGLWEKIPYGGKHVTVLLETVATSLIRNAIICIDDIERLGSGITMDELMGLVSELKNESQCKTILLFNEEQLQGEKAEQYQRASEKVIDKKLAFVTTANDAVKLGLPPDTPWRAYATSCIEALEISNIRTIQRIANGLQDIHAVIPNCSEAVKKQAAIAVVVFAGALYERGISFPSPENLVTYNWYSRTAGNGKCDIDEAWREKLHKCQFLKCDEFDAEILSVLKNGYPNGSELAKYAQRLDEVADRARLEGIFNDAWSVFRDRVDGTADDMMHKFVEAVGVAATVITPLNLNSTVNLLRELGFSTEADDVVETYIKLNSGRAGMFKIDDNQPWNEGINDKYLKKRFAEALENEDEPLDLNTVAELLIEGKVWDDRMKSTLLNASIDDFVTLIKDNQGEMMRPLIKYLYRAANTQRDETAPIGEKVNAALAKIAQESQLNESRVKRWRWT